MTTAAVKRQLVRTNLERLERWKQELSWMCRRNAWDQITAIAAEIETASSQQGGRYVAIDLALTADEDDAVASWIPFVPFHF